MKKIDEKIDVKTVFSFFICYDLKPHSLIHPDPFFVDIFFNQPVAFYRFLFVITARSLMDKAFALILRQSKLTRLSTKSVDKSVNSLSNACIHIGLR